ncbi:MAG TPA: hypothetical protein VIT67_10960 [Povalibacter sp.]
MAQDRNKQSDREHSGRTGFDDRGNAVWEWKLATGGFSRDVDTQQVMTLDLGQLSIADTGVYCTAASQSGRGAKPSSGPDPYNTVVARRADHSKSERPSRTLDDMRKLNEWIKLKNGLESRDDEES